MANTNRLQGDSYEGVTTEYDSGLTLERPGLFTGGG